MQEELKKLKYDIKCLTVAVNVGGVQMEKIIKESDKSQELLHFAFCL